MVIFFRKSVVFSLCAGIIFALILSFLAVTSVYAICVDHTDICYVKTYRDGQLAIESYMEEEREKFGDTARVQQGIALNYHFIRPQLSFLEAQEAKQLLKKNAVLDIEYKEKVAIPAETKVLPSESLPTGVEEMIYGGSSGEQENTLHAVVSNEDVTEVQVVESEILVEAKNAVVLQGTSPKFYPISTSGGFGASPVPISGKISAVFGKSGKMWSSTHTGVDIAAAEGTPVACVGYGTVITAGESGLYGNMVAIDHGNGIITRYAHLSSIAVQVGEAVETESLLGYCGSTGNATGSHLHFEVLRDHVAVDPQSYFSKILG